MFKKIIPAAIAAAMFMNVHTTAIAQWSLSGNAIVAANKLGTTNAFPLNIVTTNVQRMTVSAAGLVGIGTTAPANLLHVNGVATSTANVVVSKSNYVGVVDVRAIDGTSVSSPGYGIGVVGTGGFMGVRGDVTPTTYTGASYGGYFTNSGGTAGTHYGSYSAASGAGTINYGVFGTASGATTNWAGYFAGNTYAANLSVGNTLAATGYLLSVDGKIIAEEIRVANSTTWPDFVFQPSYNLMSLEQLEQHITTEKHLPGIPSAQQIENECGFDLGAMQQNVVQKIEELTLYVIQLNKENKILQQKVEALEALKK
jgi:hypothetical protein